MFNLTGKKNKACYLISIKKTEGFSPDLDGSQYTNANKQAHTHIQESQGPGSLLRLGQSRGTDLTPPLVSILFCTSINITWDGHIFMATSLIMFQSDQQKQIYVPKTSFKIKNFYPLLFKFCKCKGHRQVPRKTLFMSHSHKMLATHYFIQVSFSELKCICLLWSLLNFEFACSLISSLAWYFEYSIQQINHLSASVIHVNLINLHAMPSLELCLRL